MKAGPRSYAEQSRARLLDLWRGEDSFGAPRGCVATTFTFDAALFEEQCLARFLGIQSHPNETARAYLIEREEKLSQSFACVLVDQAHVCPERSLRWNLLPVTSPTGGCMHAKLSVLMWEHRVRVMIGSANLTEPGYRRNQELIAVLDYGEGLASPTKVLTECVAFINQLRRFSPGANDVSEGPQARLRRFLAEIERFARPKLPQRRSEVTCELVALVPGGKQVLAQLKSLWPDSAPTDGYVVSPFYDPEGRASETAKALAGLLTRQGKRSLSFSAPGRTLPDGTVQIDAPEALRTPSHGSLTHHFEVIAERVNVGGSDEDRPLHGKAIWLERENCALYMIGSSNFTAAGLGLHEKPNVELNLAYVVRNKFSVFGKLCGASWPAGEPIEDLDQAQFLDDGPEDSSENPGAAVLPPAFGQALYRYKTSNASLELEIGLQAPAVFEVLDYDGNALIDSGKWRVSGAPALQTVVWQAQRPPSSLTVRWQDKKQRQCAAPWVVNVEDAASLPPPEDLSDLSLEELMEILTSARPLHEIVGKIHERRKKKRSANDRHELDPHRRVDTSQFLLQRMRRVSRALEGLRERLGRPMGSLEALRWRLHGPIGAMAIAKCLAKEDPQGGAFMIAEVAETLRTVDWQRMGAMTHSQIQAEVKQVMKALHKLAVSAGAPKNLTRYVRREFKEMLP